MKSKLNNISLAAVLGAVPSMLVPVTACAQVQVQAQALDAPTQEVVVTAERVAQPLSKTPVSVGVLSSNDIELRGVTQLSDLQGQIAGVVVPNGASNQPQSVVIRGVGGSAPALSQAVGIYVDDVPLIRGYATALWDLPDIERIEVLRGPQGTLYGQNSTAGAVKIVSYQPTKDRIAWASLGVGNYSATETRGYLNGSIGGAASDIAGSLAFTHSQNDGFGYNATLGVRVNKLDVTQARGQLKWSPSAGTYLLVAADGLIDTSDTDTSNFPRNAPDSRPRVTYTELGDDSFRRVSDGLSVTGVTALAWSTLKSVTAYRAYRDNPVNVDIGGLAVERYGLDQTISQKVFTQEFQWQGQLESLSWTTGAMLEADHFVFDRFTDTYALAAPAPSESEALSRFHTVDVGLYGQGKYLLTSSTALTAGLRAYHTVQSGSNEDWKSNSSEQRTAVVYDAQGLSKVDKGLVPRLGIESQVNSQLFTYASFAKGDKFGGFNRAAQSLTSASYAANPEHVSTFEFGAKAVTADHRSSVNVALFYNDYRDYLATLNNTTIGGVLVTDSVLVNAGKAKTYGIDLDGKTLLGQGTTLSGTIELLRTRFDEFLDPTGTTNYVGNQLPNAPRLTLGASIDQKFSIAESVSSSVEAALRLVGHNYTDAANTPSLAVPTSTYVDLAATAAPVNSRWSFNARLKNVFNRAYALLPSQIPALGVNSTYYNPPRTFMFTARYAFL